MSGFHKQAWLCVDSTKQKRSALETEFEIFALRKKSAKQEYSKSTRHRFYKWYIVSEENKPLDRLSREESTYAIPARYFERFDMTDSKIRWG